MKGKNILITGGGGFIGTALAERLVDQNTVTLLDSNFENNAFRYSTISKSSNIRLANIDILNQDDLKDVVRDAQIIIHMAARLGVQEVIHNTKQTLDVNYIGTSNLLKAIGSNSECERFVFFSTSEVFGSNAFRITENGNSILNSIQDPRWCYSLSKLAAEHLVFSYFREDSLPVVVIRPFNVFGPRRIGDNVARRFILNALSCVELKVYGDGTQIRAWCYIDDFCEAVLASMENKNAIGEAFNIGNPCNTVTIYEFAKKIICLSDSKSRIVFEKLDFADIDIRVPNIEKARRILGFVPKVELDAGLITTIEWFKDHMSELKSL